MANDQSNSARTTILGRIDAALGIKTGAGAQAHPGSEWESLSRGYIRHDSLSGSALIDLFEHRIVDYGAGVYRCTSDQIRQTIEEILVKRGAKRLLMPHGFATHWLPDNFNFITDANLSYDQLNSFDGVLTTADAAIAATGSIVLQHGPGQGRRALTLIPDYHLCIVRTDQIVETVPAAFARLDPTKPTTFISGPSATADIEMTRIKGVHGPRFMDAILVAV